MSRRARIFGFSYTGPYRYFLTFCTRSRQPTLNNAVTASETLVHFLRTATEQRFAILAYCLMPDHAHLLVEGLTDGADLRRFAKLAKQRSGASYALRGGGGLWQEGHYDRALRRDEDVKNVARYVLENPVRAGLVKTPAAYPYLGSEVWSLAELLDAYH